MYYKKAEEYDFRVPREYKAYLAFKDRLNEMGVKYTEQHHSMSCTVLTVSRGEFEVDETCDILSMMKSN